MRNMDGRKSRDEEGFLAGVSATTDDAHKLENNPKPGVCARIFPRKCGVRDICTIVFVQDDPQLHNHLALSL